MAIIFLCCESLIGYPRNVDDMPWVAWISVLKLSLMWKMKIIHDLALQKIKARVNNTDEWITILKISTYLRIEGLRDLAAQTLRWTLDPLKKIELATECGFEPWLLDVYKGFLARTQTISVEEEEQLGWNTSEVIPCTPSSFRAMRRRIRRRIRRRHQI